MSREQFKELIERYLSGNATAAEERLVDDFFSAHEKKQVHAMQDAVSEETWQSISEKIQALSATSLPADNKTKPRYFSRLAIICVAGAFIITLIFAGVAKYLKRENITPSAAWVSASSVRGEKSLITLADGTKVYLNSATSITYPEVFEDDRREIILSGEAFFEVTEDKKRPLTVRTGDVITQVLGTSFNVQAFSGQDIKVTVVTGRVQVQAATTQSLADVDRLVLERNEQAIYDGHSHLEHKTVNVENAIAWKANTLYFDDDPLEEVATALERWYNVKINFDNDHIKRCRINGQYKDMELQSVLKSIQYMYQVDFQYLGQNNIQLYGKGCK